MELVMSFKKNDIELIQAIENQFGKNIIYEESKGFGGLEVLLTAIVPVTALTVQIIDFILANFWNKGKEQSNNNKRIIVDPNGNIDLKGYTEEEARKIIERYFENQNNE